MVWELKEKVNNLVMPFIMKPWAVTPENFTVKFSKERQPWFKKKYDNLLLNVLRHLTPSTAISKMSNR